MTNKTELTAQKSLAKQQIWLAYLATLVGTSLIVAGLAILPFYMDGAGLVAFLGAGLVFISSTAMYRIFYKGFVNINGLAK
jgi:hypothetical protein|tara:strand:+ start:1692 stop:1934 length:243 start_codon:yes stop_codon:yes gene_type:complete